MAQKTIFELDLVKIAKWHQRCTALAFVTIIGWIVIAVGLANMASPSVVVDLIVWGYWTILVILSVYFVVMLQRACGKGVGTLIVYGILTVLVSFLVLISSASTAGTVLRLAGAKMGFLGVSRDEVDKLRSGHCRGCGYNREGLELLQMCPECQRVPQVI